MLKATLIEDVDFYNEDPARYGRISKYLEDRRTREYRNFMGEFADDPLPTEDELKEGITKRLGRINKFIELNAPDTIIEMEQGVLAELMVKFLNNEYAKTVEEIDYKAKHDAQLRQWYDYKGIVDDLSGVM